jgi:hypothetical protein
LQKQYDHETRNSLDEKKQLEWNERIADAMKKLFSESRPIIYFVNNCMRFSPLNSPLIQVFLMHALPY